MKEIVVVEFYDGEKKYIDMDKVVEILEWKGRSDIGVAYVDGDVDFIDPTHVTKVMRIETSMGEILEEVLKKRCEKQ